MKPLVSVIINCYNGSKYLKKAINSVYLQTYENWEIIFWDNRSSDSSASIAKSYDSKLKYFLSPSNTKLGEARNLAISKAKGDFITFLDCDDFFLKQTIKLLVEKILETKYVLCYGGINIINVNGKQIKKFIPKNNYGYALPYLLKDFEINVPCCIIDNNFLKEKRLNFDKSFVASEEYNLFMKIAAFSNGMGVINEAISNYRVYENSLTNESIKFWSIERRETLNFLINKNPTLLVLYPKEFKIAFARADYYEARYLIKINLRYKAIKKLLKIFYIDYKYVFYLFLILLPNTFQEKALKFYYNR